MFLDETAHVPQRIVRFIGASVPLRSTGKPVLRRL